MVSEEGACLVHGNFQCGYELRRHAHAARGAVDQRTVGLARSVHWHRRTWLRLALVLADALSGTRRAPAWQQGGTRLHSQRSFRIGAATKIDCLASASADLSVTRLEATGR